MAGRTFEVTEVPFTAAGACTLFSPPRKGFLVGGAGTACATGGAAATGTEFTTGADVPESRACT